MVPRRQGNNQARSRALRVQHQAVSQGRSRRITVTRLRAHPRDNTRFPSSECGFDPRRPLHPTRASDTVDADQAHTTSQSSVRWEARELNELKVVLVVL